jgi:hypothetical protein
VAAHDSVDDFHDAEGRDFLEELTLKSVPNFIDHSAAVCVVGEKVPGY